MEFNIKIKDKYYKEAIDGRLEYLYGDYDAAILKEAGVPIRTALCKSLIEDEKIRGKIAKEITDYCESAIYDILDNVDFKLLAEYYDKCFDLCNRKEEAEYAARQERAKEFRIKEAIKTLEESGYTVKKENK